MKGSALALSEEGKEVFIADISKDAHTNNGMFRAAEMKDAKPGDTVATTKGEIFTLVEPSFSDLFKRINRHAQIITPKDVGMIIAETGITKDSFVVDLGTGSGALCCSIASVAKKVVSYDVDDRSIAAGKKNIELLELKNLTIEKADAYDPEAITEKNAEVITMDLPEPWNALDTAKKIGIPGAFVVCYSPHITQALETVNAARQKGLLVLKSVEIFQREWILEGKRCRPDFKGLGHTGFLTFLRKI